MITTITHTSRPLWLRALQPFVSWYLDRWERDEDAYTQQLRDGAVWTPEMLAQRERNLEPLRALAAWWRSA